MYPVIRALFGKPVSIPAIDFRSAVIVPVVAEAENAPAEAAA